MCNDKEDPLNPFVMRVSHSNEHGAPEVFISSPIILRLAAVACSTITEVNII